jgi:excisionase family DNA binding protein
MEKMIFQFPALDEIISRLEKIERKLEETTKSNPKIERLFNTKEVAQALGVSLRTLQEKRNRREIPFIQYGDIVRFRLSDIEQYFLNHHINVKTMKGSSHE